MCSLLKTKLGIEIEYMICDSKSLDIKPIADKLLADLAGKPTTEVTLGTITLSNELANHVIEMKVSTPRIVDGSLWRDVYAAIKEVGEVLESRQALLVPSGMHPWMDPTNETMLWPGEYKEHYQAYDEIFNCRTHGFANLQSIHINIPFNSDEEFGRLHAAIRILLPLLPALAASSPFKDNQLQETLDSRLEAYRTNQKKVTSVAGKVIPEPIFTMADYKKMLHSMYQDIKPYDPDGILQTEQLNSRGCIARFDRNTFEIRLVDSQECALTDTTIAWAVMYILDELLQEKHTDYNEQRKADTDDLYAILVDTIRDAEHAKVTNIAFLHHFGINEPTTAGEILKQSLKPALDSNKLLDKEMRGTLTRLLDKGTLATRMRREYNNGSQLGAIYSDLASCLKNNLLYGISKITQSQHT